MVVPISRCCKGLSIARPWSRLGSNSKRVLPRPGWSRKMLLCRRFAALDVHWVTRTANPIMFRKAHWLCPIMNHLSTTYKDRLAGMWCPFFDIMFDSVTYGCASFQPYRDERKSCRMACGGKFAGALTKNSSLSHVSCFAPRCRS